MGWNVISVDGHDARKVGNALRRAKKSDKPTLIACKTIIGKGAPTKAGTSKVHGAPLGDDEIAATRKALGWNHDPFTVPEHVYKMWKRPGRRGRAAQKAWAGRLKASKKTTDFTRAVTGNLNLGWKEAMQSYKDELVKSAPKEATRVSSGNALKVLTENITAVSYTHLTLPTKA